MTAAEIAARWILAVDTFHDYVHSTSPFETTPAGKTRRDEAHLEDLKAEKTELYYAFLEARPVAVGDVVELHADRSKGTPSGTVLRVSEKTVTVTTPAGAEARFPLEKIHRPWNDALRAARELVAATPEELAEEEPVAELPFVVIPCGGEKLDVPAIAVELYVGSYFRAVLRAARALTTDDRIRILSARYGLVALDEGLDPYDLRIDAPGAVDADFVARQILAEPALSKLAFDTRRIVVLAGQAYASVAVEALDLAGVGIPVELPFEGARGIGDHLARAKAIAEGELVDDDPNDVLFPLDVEPAAWPVVETYREAKAREEARLEELGLGVPVDERPPHPYLDEIPTTGGPLEWVRLLPLEVEWIVGDGFLETVPTDRPFVVGFEEWGAGSCWTIVADDELDEAVLLDGEPTILEPGVELVHDCAPSADVCFC